MFAQRIRFVWISLSLMAVLSACSSSGNQSTTRVCKNVASDQYCVKSGDTLSKIAQKHKISIANLKAWNGLKNDRIQIGQKLTIRKNDAQTAQSNNSTPATPKQNQNYYSGISLKSPLETGTVIRHYSATNKGIDIAAPRGSMVYAAADGTVIYAGSGVRGYGKLLLIRHSPTTLTAYAHNDSLLVAEKATVKAGQMIATVGDSGRTDGQTALHFELRINGKHVNPAAYLR